eukprot:6059694-Pyramimonas_sp.AAC.2
MTEIEKRGGTFRPRFFVSPRLRRIGKTGLGAPPSPPGSGRAASRRPPPPSSPPGACGGRASPESARRAA